MISKKNCETTEITVHGNTHNEQSADELYPFQICPECMSSNTKIADKPHYEWCRKGLFVYRKIHVIHECKDCKCKWIHSYLEKDHDRIIDENVSAIIIAFLISALSAFSLMCELSVESCYNGDDIPKSLIIWCAISCMILLISISVWMFCLCEVFGK